MGFFIFSKKSMIEIEKKICVVSVETLQELFELWWWDCVALYMFYHKQCKLQKTNQSRSTDSFTCDWLWRWLKKLKKNKDILISKWLIEFIKNHKPDGTFGKMYVKLNYIWKQAKFNQTVNFTQVAESTSGWQETNALNDKKEMLKVNKIKKDIFLKNENPVNNEFSDILNERIDEFKQHRKEIKKKMTDRAFSLFIKKIQWLILEYSEDDVLTMIDDSIMNWRQTLYPRKDMESKKEVIPKLPNTPYEMWQLRHKIWNKKFKEYFGEEHALTARIEANT